MTIYPALSRGPCSYCGVRGELGCRHQTAYEPPTGDAKVEYREMGRRGPMRKTKGQGAQKRKYA